MLACQIQLAEFLNSSATLLYTTAISFLKKPLIQLS